MAEKLNNLTTYQISFYDRATGMPINDERGEEGRRRSDTPPTAPMGDEVAILYIESALTAQDIFWGFDGKWHKEQPNHWDLLDEIEHVLTTSASDMF